jgi:D-amino peptidase
MKILISADMEGTAGVSSWVQVIAPETAGSEWPSNQTEYERARLRMTQEVNAAIEGAFAGGATEVIVNDSHSGMRNILPDLLPRDTRYISGNDKPFGMMQGIDIEGIAGVFYTGYHAKAGTPKGPLAHTWTTYLQDVRFDGRSTGEFGINAVVAGHFGVPVVLVTGDHLAVAQTQDLLGPQVVGVAVKTGISSTSAMHMQPQAAQDRIREMAEKAMGHIATATPFLLPETTTVEMDFDHQSRADQVVLMEGVERVGERTISFVAGDGLQFCRRFRAAMKLAGIRMAP